LLGHIFFELNVIIYCHVIQVECVQQFFKYRLLFVEHSGALVSRLVIFHWI